MVSKFYVYETLHAGESESIHYDELAEWGVEPDLVGIEADPQAAKSDGLLTRSPGTSAVLAFNTLLTRFQMESRLPPSGAGGTIAAARLFAQEIGAPVVALDQRTHGEYVETLSRTRCVGETALALVAVVTMLALPGPLGSPPPSGFLGAASSAVVDGTIGALLAAFVVLPAVFLIRWGYVRWLRSTRPAEMVETAVESCADRDAETALLVVGTSLTDDFREHAEAAGIEVEVRSSPAARGYNGGPLIAYRLERALGLT